MSEKFDNTKVLNAYLISENTADDNSVIARISTNSLNRNGYIFNQFGGDYTNYLKNPIVLAFHKDDVPPIGLASDFQVSEPQSVCKITFNETKDGMDFRNLYKSDPPKMRAFSATMLPLEGKENDNGTVNIDKWELLEISAVNVPADPNAVVLRNCINMVKSVRLKKEFERQLFEVLINDVNSLREKIEQDKRFDGLNEKLENALKTIAENKNMLDMITNSKQKDEYSKIQEVKNNINTIKNDYKKINDLLETYR